MLLKRAEGGLLSKFLGPLIKFGLMLMNTEFVPLAKTEIQMSNQMMDRRERGIHGYIQLLQKTSSNQIQRKKLMEHFRVSKLNPTKYKICC